MELDHDWMANLDPQLRNSDTSISLKQWSDQPLQRFLGEPQKPLFTAHPYPPSHQQYENFQQDFNSGPAPHPYVYKRQMYSPAPSSQEQYSICSSALSPNSADNDYSKESFQQSEGHQFQGGFDSSPLSRSASSHNSSSVPDLIWPSKCFHPQVDQVIGGVSLSQLQGIPDQGDIIYQEDEGFMDNEMDHIKSEFPTRTHSNMITSFKQETPYPSSSSYRRSVDEGIGQSFKDESSPSRRSSYQTIDMDDDIDADANLDDEVPLTEQMDDDEEDDEYRPRGTTAVPSTRRRRRTSTKSSPTPINTKRSKVTKSTPSPNSNNNNHRSSSPFQCPSCSKNAFANSSALQKHISSVHTRAFVCAFGFAGCESRFASKNEWKRHVGSQHLCLNYWRCDVGVCGKSSSPTNQTSQSPSHPRASNDPYGDVGRENLSSGQQQQQQHHHHGNSTKTNEFNRKDLFTQHLRRMHAPFAVKRQGKKVESWEDRVRELQTSSLRIRREAPWRTGCPVTGCNGSFEGKGSWDERMEHVAKHLEKVGGVSGSQSKGDARVHREIAEGVDEDLLQWSLREGIVEQRVGGGWRLCGSEKGSLVAATRIKKDSCFGEEENDEDDAEGEEDV